MNKTVAILPGIFSGKYTTQRLRKLLCKAGYLVVDSATDADIVLAHSAGCLFLPPENNHQTIVLVNPPYWPGKTIAQRAHDRSRSNIQFYKRDIPCGRWLVRNLRGAYYTIREPRRTRFIMRHMEDFDLEAAIKHPHVIVVRNELDDWLTPDLERLRTLNPNLKAISLPGDHDDFNYHPEQYVNLLKSEA